MVVDLEEITIVQVILEDLVVVLVTLLVIIQVIHLEVVLLNHP
tara:strand:+ start:99 stop:227 length:129 start_codon:yes stop_codon:yes gene_type:complete